MIPKALLLTFLSWPLSETPLQGTKDTPALLTKQSPSIVHYDVDSPYEQTAPNIHESSLVQIESLPNREDVAVETPILTNRITYTFDGLPPGDWNPDTVVHKSFRLLSGTEARIYVIEYAFPNLPVENKQVWSAYPTGSNLTIRFVDGVHAYSAVRFGWVVNQKLAPASWRTDSYNGGKYVSGTRGTNSGTWTTVSNPSYLHDERRLTVLGGVVSGVLIVQSITYEEPTSSLTCEGPSVHVGL